MIVYIHEARKLRFHDFSYFPLRSLNLHSSDALIKEQLKALFLWIAAGRLE